MQIPKRHNQYHQRKDIAFMKLKQQKNAVNKRILFRNTDIHVRRKKRVEDS